MMKKKERLNAEIPFPDLDIDAFIGEGTSFDGKFVFKGVVRIDGDMRGEIECDGTLIVGESGVLTASVITKDAVVRGKVIGNILTKGRLELKSPSVMEGDIRAGSLYVEDGVSINGNIACGNFIDSDAGRIEEEMVEEIVEDVEELKEPEI